MNEVINEQPISGTSKLALYAFVNNGRTYVDIDSLIDYISTNFERIGINTDTSNAQLKILRDGTNDLLLRCEGEIRDTNNPQFGRYLSYIDSNTCNVMTNGAMVINGRSVTNGLVAYDVGGETNFMLGIESDVAGPTIKVKVDVGDVINAVNGGNAEIFKVKSDGSTSVGSDTNSFLMIGKVLANNHHIVLQNGAIKSNYSLEPNPRYKLSANGLELGEGVNPPHVKLYVVGPNVSLNQRLILEQGVKIQGTLVFTGATSLDANTNATVPIGDTYIWDDGNAQHLMIKK